MEKLTIAYKVVQVQDGRYFSANPNEESVRLFIKNENRRINNNTLIPNIVEYKVGYITMPLKHLPVLFVVEYSDAYRAQSFYSRSFPSLRDKRNDCKILKGYAFNFREFKYDKKVLLEKRVGCIPLPNKFKTFLCDWFVTTEVL